MYSWLGLKTTLSTSVLGYEPDIAVFSIRLVVTSVQAIFPSVVPTLKVAELPDTSCPSWYLAYLFSFASLDILVLEITFAAKLNEFLPL
jgi:hypothetical protein